MATHIQIYERFSLLFHSSEVVTAIQFSIYNILVLRRSKKSKLCSNVFPERLKDGINTLGPLESKENEIKCLSSN